MPTSNEIALWAALGDKKNDKRYEAAQKIIAEHPDEDLVNSVNPDGKGNSLLMELVRQKNVPSALIALIANHASCNITFSNPRTKVTTVESIMLSLRMDLFALFIHNPKFIYNHGRGTLAWEFAKKCAGVAKGDDKNTCESMMTQLRDLTIRYAIEKDDTTLLDKLQKAGADVLKPLVDGTEPSSLTPAESKTSAWFFKIELEAARAVGRASGQAAAQLAAHQKRHGDQQSILFANAARAASANAAQAERILQVRS